MTGLTAELREFLCAGTRTAKLAFTAADGRPLVAPVWFVVEGPDDAPELLFNTGRHTAKGRAIQRDPLAPGGQTKELVLRSGLGYTGEQPRMQMLQNSQFVDAKVEIFLRQGSRVWAKLAEFPIQRQLLTQ